MGDKISPSEYCCNVVMCKAKKIQTPPACSTNEEKCLVLTQRSSTKIAPPKLTLVNIQKQRNCRPTDVMIDGSLRV